MVSRDPEALRRGALRRCDHGASTAAHEKPRHGCAWALQGFDQGFKGGDGLLRAHDVAGAAGGQVEQLEVSAAGARAGGGVEYAAAVGA